MLYFQGYRLFRWECGKIWLFSALFWQRFRLNFGFQALPALGQTLEVSGGSWNQPPTALTYQWERCNANGRLCAAITGATASTYAVTAADSTHTLVVAVAATLNGAQQAALSTHTGVVP